MGAGSLVDLLPEAWSVIVRDDEISVLTKVSFRSNVLAI